MPIDQDIVKLLPMASKMPFLPFALQAIGRVAPSSIKLALAKLAAEGGSVREKPLGQWAPN